VKLLYVHRENALRHEIREYEIDVHLRLGTQKDYVEGDNRDIIATDSQKNTVYLMAKKHGVKSPEEFGILLCSHFLYQYKHVEEVNVNVEEYPWSRHEVEGVPHNHAFVFTPTATRYCQVTQLRNGKKDESKLFAKNLHSRGWLSHLTTAGPLILNHIPLDLTSTARSITPLRNLLFAADKSPRPLRPLSLSLSLSLSFLSSFLSFILFFS
jgi:hypothetical protein